MADNMRQFWAVTLEIAEIAVIAIAAVFIIRTFLIQPFLVSGASMAPNFQNGDYLLVDELTYHVRPPERGEVVVFRYPEDETKFFIKRIVGLPGERLQFKDGHLVVFNSTWPQGQVLDEKYLASEVATTAHPGGKMDYALGSGQYLTLGDNRPYSFDSRDWGVLNQKEIIGLVRFRLWPPTELTVFAAPSYNN